MRRFWSYIILCVTSLVLIGATFVNVFSKVNANVEFAEGKEITFRVEDKDDEDNEFITYDAVNEVAETMIERLEALDVTQYKVTTHGYDTIKVNLNQPNTLNYEYIKQLLTFSGSEALALTSKVGDVRIGTEFLTDDATLEVVDDYPAIRVPVGNEFADLLKIVQDYQLTNNQDAAEVSESGEEGESTSTYYLYLWYDYDPDTCTFEATDSSSESYDEDIARRLFMKFDISQMKNEDNEDLPPEYIQAYVKIQDANGDGVYEAKDVKQAYDTANFYVNLINSSKLDYKVSYLYETISSPWTESLITDDNKVAWSNTLIATLCGLAVVSLLLVVFYRLGALGVVSSTVATIFGAIAMIVVFSAEFNLAAIIGLVAVALASLSSAVVYMAKFKEECYRGRSLKKANAEGGKKALLPTVDIHAVLISIGVFSYIFGGAIMRGFAVVTVLGGLISLISSTLFLRGLMWLSTNTTSLQGKYNYFGIENKDIPNVGAEEKQKYFGPYADKDLTKKKKPVGIIALVGLLAGLAGFLVFGIKDGGVVYNNGSAALATEVYVETDTKNTLITEAVIVEVLENTYILSGEEVSENDKKLSSYVVKDENGRYDILYKTVSEYIEQTEVVTNYYVITLTEDLTDAKAYYYDGTTVVMSVENEGLEQLIEDQLAISDSEAIASIKKSQRYSELEPDFLPILYGTLVGVGVAVVYLMIRYRLSRGIAALITTVGGTATVTGIFALTRLPVTSYAAIALPILAFVSLVLAIIFANKDRELFLEDKTHDNSVENRNAIMVKSTSLAFYPVLLFTILALYIAVDFFGFGATGYSWVFMIIGVGLIVITALTTVLYGPISQFFFKIFAKVKENIKLPKRTKKKKSKANTAKKSSEPEEYVFIGIND